MRQSHQRSARRYKGDDGAWRVTPDSIRESLIANLGLLDHAMQLVTLRTDVPIDPELQDFQAFASPKQEGAGSPAAAKPAASGKQERSAPPPRSQPAPSPAARSRQPSRFSAASVSHIPNLGNHITILTGKSGVGKTHLISTIPSVFIVPVEHKLKGASPDHNPAHFAETPRTIAELHQALDVFMDLNMAGEDGKRKFRHLALDSMFGIEKLVHAAACGTERAEHMEAKDFKKVWYAAEPFWHKVQEKLDVIRHSGVDVWIVAHSAEVPDASTTTGEIYRRWDIQLKGTGPTGIEARHMWRAWVDNVFFLDWVVDVQAGSKTKRSLGRYKGRVLYTRESANYYAKTRLRLPPSLPATWEDLAKAWAAGVSAPDKRLRAELDEILPQLAPEDRELIEAELPTATGNRLSALVSRAQGMLAISLEDAPPAAEAEEALDAA